MVFHCSFLILYVVGADNAEQMSRGFDCSQLLMYNLIISTIIVLVKYQASFSGKGANRFQKLYSQIRDKLLGECLCLFSHVFSFRIPSQADLKYTLKQPQHTFSEPGYN